MRKKNEVVPTSRSSADEERVQSLRTLVGGRFDLDEADEAVKSIESLQKRQSLGGDVSIEDLINDGRDV